MTNDFWVRFVIENSIVVIVLALIAEGIARWTKNARIANLLWLVVLVKFLIPSFLFCELPLLPSQQPLAYASVAIPQNREFSNVDATTQTVAPLVEMPTIAIQPEPNTTGTESNERNLSSNNTAVSKRNTHSISWTSVMGLLWLCGSILWFGCFALRLSRFRLGLQASYRASDSLQSLAKQIALKFRLVHVPEIRVVDDAISPILWSCGRDTSIILPANMIDSTPNDGMTAVLAHEMAHLKRLDHWVQRLAMLVMGLSWWHPVSWLAVRRLRQTQDACCDLDVLEWDSNLQIAFARALVEVAARVRSTAPPMALAFLDQYSLRARVQNILQDTNRAKLGVFKSCFILLCGFGLASVSARIVAQTPTKQEANSTKPSTSIQSSKQESETKTASESNSQSEIEVVEPDGSIAVNARYVIGKRHARFRLDASLEVVPELFDERLGKTLAVSDGKIPLDFDPASDFLAVWSEKGFLQIAISRIFTTKSIQLQGWVTLEANLATNDGPDDGATLSVSNYWTTDGQFFAMAVSTETLVADKNGRVIVNRVPPGTIVIRTNVKEIRKGNSGWEQHDRSRTLRAVAGETIRLTLGGSGRNVRGTLAFPQDVTIADFETLSGKIESLQNQESISIEINNDGSFECEDVPIGPCKIEVRSRIDFHPGVGRTRYSASKLFECTSNETGILSIGSIQLERNAISVSTQESLETITSPDPFQSTQKVAVVGTEKREKTIYTLLDNEGKLIRSLENIAVPDGWASVSHYVAFDVPHDRLYLLSAYDKATKSQTLVTLNLSGKVMATRLLESLSSCRIAANTTTGDLWLLNVESIGKSKVLVFDLQGSQTKTYPLDAFTLCYSEVDKAFWLAGSRAVNKVNPLSGELIATYRLPTGIWTCTDVIPDPSGGTVCIEGHHPDMPKSANRIWCFDSNANRVGSWDVDKMFILSVAFVYSEIWVCGTTRDGALFGNPKFSNAFMCFSSKLEPIADRELGFSYLQAEADGKGAWAIAGKKLHKVTKDKDGLIQKTTLSTSPIEGMLWARGN